MKPDTFAHFFPVGPSNMVMHAKPTSLEVIEIASPCSMKWADMQGDDRIRHCCQCDLNVYNLSGMGRQEALDLVHAAEGRMCVRMLKRHDGTVITQDCPVGLRALRLKAVKMVTATVAFAAALVLAPLVGNKRSQAQEPGQAVAAASEVQVGAKRSFFGEAFRNVLLPLVQPPQFEVIPFEGEIAGRMVIEPGMLAPEPELLVPVPILEEPFELMGDIEEVPLVRSASSRRSTDERCRLADCNLLLQAGLAGPSMTNKADRAQGCSWSGNTASTSFRFGLLPVWIPHPPRRFARRARRAGCTPLRSSRWLRCC